MRPLILSMLLVSVASGLAMAQDMATLTGKGAKLLTGEQKEALLVGRTFDGVTFDETGKEIAHWTLQYAKDGAKIVEADVNGNTIQFVRKWWMDGDAFCEQATVDDQSMCEDLLYKLDSKCFTFYENGGIRNEMSC
jgi:hypothetical protein